jgi:hypothetical protein
LRSVELSPGFFIDGNLLVLLYFPFNVVVAVVLPRVVAYTAIVKPLRLVAVTERPTLLKSARVHRKPHLITMAVTIGVAMRCGAESIVIRGGVLNVHGSLPNYLIFSVDFHDLDDVCVK